MSSNSPRREEFTYPAAEKGTLLISNELQRKIEWLHKQVGKIEWCGILFYKRLEGDIDNPKTLKLLAEDLYLMDIGRETYTEADFDPNTTVEMWETVNDDYTFKRGLIHTHHTMATFFSGTDMQELHDNTGSHNYYLSLIVNFNGVWTAKVAHVAKRKLVMEYKNVSDETKEFVTEKELLMMIDMNIVKEQVEVAVPDFFRTRYETLKTQIEERAAEKAAAIANATAITVSQGSMLGDEDDFTGHGDIMATPTKRNVSSATSVDKKTSAIITPEGNLQKGKQTLVPMGKVTKDILTTVLDWLNTGLTLCSDMRKDSFDSIERILKYYNDYFNDPAHDTVQYNYFIGQLQRIMVDKFTKWNLNLVQRIGMEEFELHLISNVLGAAIYDMFECFPQYLIETVRTQKDKKRQIVHARR